MRTISGIDKGRPVSGAFIVQNHARFADNECLAVINIG